MLTSCSPVYQVDYDAVISCVKQLTAVDQHLMSRILDELSNRPQRVKTLDSVSDTVVCSTVSHREQSWTLPVHPVHRRLLPPIRRRKFRCREEKSHRDSEDTDRRHELEEQTVAAPAHVASVLTTSHHQNNHLDKL